jgi:S-adenosylmethionine:tRNA ribosyltransferase-isomerase
LKTIELDYDIPSELIAQTPIEPRDAARLLVLDRRSGALAHRGFREVVEYLRRGDVLVCNETRVLSARLQAVKIPTGGRVEVLLLRRLDATTWEGLAGGSGVRVGSRLRILPIVEGASRDVTAEVIAEFERGGRVLRFDRPIDDRLDVLGSVPLPPYIRQPLEDSERYQTIFARLPGSVAAPTAGLHFTPGLVQTLREHGVEVAFVELRVSLDTFRPILEEEVERHRIHTEYCRVSTKTVEQIERARRSGGRVIAVGTTAVRTLETAACGDGRVSEYAGDTSLFITPGYRFSVIDAMITNFHMPRSTLLALVAAFAGLEQTVLAYRAAIAEQYRFYSFGDAMLIL